MNLMEINNILITNLLINNLSKIKLDNKILESIIYILIIVIPLCYNTNILNNIYDLINNKNIIYNKVILESNNKSLTQKFRSVMYYIVNHCDIKELKEYEMKKYDWDDNLLLTSGYKVVQTTKFKIKDNIFGKVYFENKEVTVNNKTITSQQQFLEIASMKDSVIDIINFINSCEKDYLKYLKNKIIENKLIIDISWNMKDSCIEVSSSPWKSNSKFENRFFNNKEAIIKKINFFINNKKWYIEKGMQHTLGLLLYGEGGCGKTGFIRSLANHEGYEDKHIINIKLSSRFNFTKLSDIIFNERINNDLIIPLDKRIIVIEDIDCMDDIVKERESENKEKKIDDIIKKSDIDKYLKSFPTFTLLENENNNLSYLLNILEGLKESEDRIIIMTTNHPEKLDKALVRSGRVDLKIHFKKASNIDIQNMLNHFWDSRDCIIPLEWSYIITHADITNYCKSSNDLEETMKIIECYVNRSALKYDVIKILNSYWESDITDLEYSKEYKLFEVVKYLCLESSSIDQTLKIIS